MAWLWGWGATENTALVLQDWSGRVPKIEIWDKEPEQSAEDILAGSLRWIVDTYSHDDLPHAEGVACFVCVAQEALKKAAVASPDEAKGGTE